MGKYWSGNNRAPWHDYTSRRIYHITLMKHPDAMPFGHLAGDWRQPVGSLGSSYIEASPLGKIIKDCLREISCIHPALRLYQYALMPDHLHLILAVEMQLDEILGRKLAEYKVIVNKRAGTESVFSKGFNDQLLTNKRSLGDLYSYLRSNPRRLAIRFAHPDFFRRLNGIEIRGKRYSAYGNIHLLANPFKSQVVIHRADSTSYRDMKRNEWLYTAANGGVLVSPFISRAEKEVRSEAEAGGGRAILIVHEAFGERFKPQAHDFGLCADGRLLIISAGLPAGSPLERTTCLHMNTLAETICNINAYELQGTETKG